MCERGGGGEKGLQTNITFSWMTHRMGGGGGGKGSHKIQGGGIAEIDSLHNKALKVPNARLYVYTS